MTPIAPISTICTCRQYDFILGLGKTPPHAHLVVDVADLQVDDRPMLSEVLEEPHEVKTLDLLTMVSVYVQYEGGLKIRNLYFPGQKLAITRFTKECGCCANRSFFNTPFCTPCMEDLGEDAYK